MPCLAPGSLSPDHEWFTDGWTSGLRLSVRVKEVLRDLRSPFQHVLVLDTHEMGRMLVLDGNIQCSEADEAAYHELIVHPGLCRQGARRGDDKAVLIIGGGDGGAAREALRHSSVSRVDLIDIDPEVTRAARDLLPGVWKRPYGSGPLHEDERLTVRNEDGLAFLESSPDRPEAGYDLVVVDATDPIGPGAILFSDRFYQALRSSLREGGAVSVQAGSWWCLPEVLKTAHGGLKRVFGRAEAYQCWSAVYPGGLWNLVMATLGDDPAQVDETRAGALSGCLFYDASVHRAAFALGPRARAVLQVEV
ncbi:MAG: spermidine synthase [Myxococcota bacterium]